MTWLAMLCALLALALAAWGGSSSEASSPACVHASPVAEAAAGRLRRPAKKAPDTDARDDSLPGLSAAALRMDLPCHDSRVVRESAGARRLRACRHLQAAVHESLDSGSPGHGVPHRTCVLHGGAACSCLADCVLLPVRPVCGLRAVNGWEPER